ncbi:hypothetical protein KIW84_015594 [Lathyrus oleraceus]|uniref:Pentatricopeptide repeat-containing protein n=1 Tax=Pisum sativum TaxID=3888 RepID=A0A9D5BRE5_PEA|nr:hypothetical protein KIW84_015594 [Pisum sativum]
MDCCLNSGWSWIVFVGSALVNTYLKFGLVVDAHEVFEELPVRDVVLWNSMVNGYAHIGCFEEALWMFRRTEENGMIPCKYAVTGVLSIYYVIGDFDNGQVVHGFVTKIGYGSSVVVSNALIDMHAKCGNMRDARMVFDIMIEKDVASWNIMITGYGMHGYGDEALDIFSRMAYRDVVTWNSTITATKIKDYNRHLIQTTINYKFEALKLITGILKLSAGISTEHMIPSKVTEYGSNGRTVPSFFPWLDYATKYPLSELFKARPPLWNTALQSESFDDDELEHFEDVIKETDKELVTVSDKSEEPVTVSDKSDEPVIASDKKGG